MFSDDMLIFKTDASGNASWIKKIATPDSEAFTDIVETSGNDLVAVGSTISMTTFQLQAVVEKFNFAGTKQWSKSYGVSGLSSSAKCIVKDGAGNLYILGSVDVAGSLTDYFVMKLDADGNIIAQSTFGTPQSDFPLAFHRSSNGDLYIAGWQNNGTGENIHILKINNSLGMVWNKLVSSTDRYFAYDIGEKSDGSIVLAGRFDDTSTSYDILICNLDDSNGEQVWAKKYSAIAGMRTYAYGLTIGAGDEIAVTGIVEGTDQGTLFLGVNGSGNISTSWQSGVAGSIGNGYGISKSSDGGYMICGPLGGSSNEIVQMIKTNGNGEIPCNNSEFGLSAGDITLPSNSLTIATGTAVLTAQDVTLTEAGFNTIGTICIETGLDDLADEESIVYPNPASGSFTVTVPGNFGESLLQIYNSGGKEIFRQFLNPGSMAVLNNEHNLDIPSGIYVIRITSGVRQIIRKLVVIAG
jgi:hypothetical protein